MVLEGTVDEVGEFDSVVFQPQTAVKISLGGGGDDLPQAYIAVTRDQARAFGAMLFGRVRITIEAIEDAPEAGPST